MREAQDTQILWHSDFSPSLGKVQPLSRQIIFPGSILLSQWGNMVHWNAITQCVSVKYVKVWSWTYIYSPCPEMVSQESFIFCVCLVYYSDVDVHHLHSFFWYSFHFLSNFSKMFISAYPIMIHMNRLLSILLESTYIHIQTHIDTHL